MNKAIKIGLFLVIIGIVAFVVYAIIDEKFPNFTNEDFTLVEKTYASDRFTSFSVDLINQEVIIGPSDNNEIKIKYYESEKTYINVTEGEAVLEMEGVNERVFFGLLYGLSYLASPEYSRYYLYLPTDSTYDIDLSTDNGSITFSDYNPAGAVTLGSQNGEIEIENITSSGSINATTSNGRITVTDTTSSGDIYLSTSNGRVILTDVTGSHIECESQNGDIEGSNIQFTDLECETSNGSIDLSVDVAFADFYLKMATTNGHYTLNGDRTTQNAFNTSIEQMIDLKTSNGNIEINFAE